MTTEIVPAKGPAKGNAVTAVTNTHGTNDAPLDFSFYNLTTIAEAIDVEPRGSAAATKGKAPVSDSNGTVAKYQSQGVRFNNNNLADFLDLHGTLERLVTSVTSLRWLDFSFNEITKVDEALGELPQLQILYLHGNQITELREVDKLMRISSLKKVTFHGNPIENDKIYKSYVISKLPQIQVLDFSTVTKGDRRTAASLNAMYGKRSNKKKKPKE